MGEIKGRCGAKIIPKKLSQPTQLGVLATFAIRSSQVFLQG